MRVLALIIAAVLVCGCTAKHKAPGQKLEGINGSATYIFNAEGKVIFVGKDSFNIPNEWAVFINRDTIKLGDRFEGFANSRDPSFSLNVTEPTKDHLVPTGEVKSVQYNYTPQSIGKYSFKGTLQTGKEVVPFNYKFIVVH